MVTDSGCSPVPGSGYSRKGGAAKASPAEPSIPNAEREAQAAASLGELYCDIQCGHCPEIVCTYPHDGNCWCFNTALARHTALAIERIEK